MESQEQNQLSKKLGKFIKTTIPSYSDVTKDLCLILQLK